jgi:hypothetical protein
MNAAAAKIQMLKGSMRCFVFGLLGLLPAIGLPFALMAMASRDHPRVFFWFCFVISVFSIIGLPLAVVALMNSAQVRAREKLYWNAAGHYRVLGDVGAIFGIIVSFIVIVLIAYIIMNYSVSYFGVSDD